MKSSRNRVRRQKWKTNTPEMKVKMFKGLKIILSFKISHHFSLINEKGLVIK